MEVKVLGNCCKKCNETEDLIKKVIEVNALDVTLEKVGDVKQIAKYGVMRTPAVVVDGKVKIVGKVPTEDEILKLLRKE